MRADYDHYFFGTGRSNCISNQGRNSLQAMFLVASFPEALIFIALMVS